MKILSVNAGSSSLKFQMYEMPEETVLISGVFERIGLDNSFYTIKINGEKIKKDATLSSHEDAVNILIKELLENKDEYERMSKASNPYGDGKASIRIVNAIIEKYK